MDFEFTPEQNRIRSTVRDICRSFPGEYWRELDSGQSYPQEFVDTLTRGGWLAALIPEEFGGIGVGVLEASIILEEINRSGGNAAACHAQMYIMGTLLRHGSEEQKRRYLPPIASGDIRLQAFGITEPNAGSDSTRIETAAVREGDQYVINGQKIFISRVQHSDLMLLLARTSPYDERDRAGNLSVFLVDLREAGDSIRVSPLETMVNHETNVVHIEDLHVPAENRIGEEGRGFRYILSGMNAERILIAAESIGDARFFIERAVAYAGERIVFDRPIGQNQGVQFPIAAAYAQMEAADLVRYKAAARFDAGRKAGAEANMAKYLASEAAWAAANMCMDTFGGYGMAREYDIERKFRESRLYKVAPVTNHLILSFLGHNVLGLPKSYG
ncbi:MAG: acyl-CoA dehydrogenase family protein [Anaerolineales bacterium]|nr:acyl-CoA dehydrogenase family protein [Anaerolineales bacterium]